MTKRTQRAILELIASENEGTTIRTYGIIPRPMNTDLRRQAYPGDNASLPSPKENIEIILSIILKPSILKTDKRSK